VAVLYGYRGKGYHGSTKSGSQDLPTIEADLEKALKQAGAVDDQSGLSNISFSRASRTDKGVSAMANACAGQLYFSQAELDDRSIWIDRVNSFLPENIRVWNAFRVRGSFSAKEAPCSRTYDYVAPSFCFSPTDEPRMDEATLANLNALLLYFLGTNNFHNYTNGKNVNSKDAKRVILSFKVLERADLSGQEFLHFRIKGQSFMLHQIRKMICMVIHVARQGALQSAEALERAKQMIHGSFGAPHVNIMKAPSVGLFLKEVHFDVYNGLWGTGEGRERVEFAPELHRQIEAFARANIWPDIAEEAEEFRSFIKDLSEYPMNYEDLVKTYREMEAARELRLERMGGKEKTAVQHF
jgi:tRNA pseudouridine38-40 synthase